MLIRPRRFARYAWGVLVFTLLVILWGAFVRASGSGAGCGAHWPLCNGVALPRSPALATVIEFTHRLMSGLLGLLVLALVVLAVRTFPRGAGMRAPATLVGVFTVTEALVGAGLVLFQYVADNVSVARAFWMAAHLLNTFLLLGALAVTVHRASVQAGMLPADALPPLTAGLRRLVALTIGALLVLGCSGAITALGDTLALSGRVDPAAHPLLNTLVGLRLYHPLLAFLTGAVVTFTGARVRLEAPGTRTAKIATTLVVLFAAQLLVGLLNVQLLAPLWLQLVHLLLTDTIWMLVVVLADLTRYLRVPETPYPSFQAAAT